MNGQVNVTDSPFTVYIRLQVTEMMTFILSLTKSETQRECELWDRSTQWLKLYQVKRFILSFCSATLSISFIGFKLAKRWLLASNAVKTPYPYSFGSAKNDKLIPRGLPADLPYFPKTRDELHGHHLIKDGDSMIIFGLDKSLRVEGTMSPHCSDYCLRGKDN